MRLGGQIPIPSQLRNPSATPLIRLGRVGELDIAAQRQNIVARTFLPHFLCRPIPPFHSYIA